MSDLDTVDTTRFNLIFEGNIEPDHEPDDVWRALKLLFEFDNGKQASVFSGRPVVLGESMDASTANSFSQALASAGATTRLEAANDAVANETVIERQSTDRRMVATRRAQPRPNAIQPDRRKGERRQK